MLTSDKDNPLKNNLKEKEALTIFFTTSFLPRPNNLNNYMYFCACICKITCESKTWKLNKH